ncbi:MAG: fasciclin domain-containing protein [Dysgonamonadaceae bacterium]|nr:fasciclin domain-containing protein [Dysgonamonadaceae bacterium]
MKRKMKNIKNCILCALLFACLPACDDTFNTHYSEETGIAPEFTLWQLIEQEDDLSVFAGMLRKTGYDVLLSKAQAFSVWAPNNLALQGVDTTDTGKMKDIVLTHIARFQYATDNESDRLVLTLNDKRIRFVSSGDRYTMNGSELAITNQLANNGILHTMKEPVPFVKNLWEYLSEPGMDSIRNYFDAFHLKMFLPGSSKVIDYVEGMAVYDSIFFESNELFYQSLDGVGFLNNEDSLYTMILPNNTAWIKAYDQRKPYFETQAPNADSVQHWNTQYSIVQDLVFRGSIDAPGQLDTILSTRNNVFRDPAGLFPTGPASLASNGLVYITDELKHSYWESWQHPLQIEAERSQVSLLENGITSTPAKVMGVYIPEYADSVPSKRCVLISNGNNSTSATTFLLFNIPNTLKAEYSVYAVFAPIRYCYPNFASERTKIRFDIQQLDRSTADRPIDRQVWKSLIGIAPGGSGALPPDNETDSAAVKKMFLTNITFPEANYREETATIRIKLISRLTTAEVRAGYNNRMLLDYLLLEPVH